jgi:hypothetical protein
VAPQEHRPEISPYVFPVLLAGFGLWCLWDGWISTNPAMQEHYLFNRIGSAVILPWALWDFLRVRQRLGRAPDEPPKGPEPPGTSPR